MSLPTNAAQLDAVIQAGEVYDIAIAAGATEDQAHDHAVDWMREYQKWEIIQRLGLDNGPPPVKDWTP